MGIKRQDTLIHWNYFLSIEEDLYRLNRYVDFSKNNDSTFSIEIARILMAASAEVDVVLKQLCLAIDSRSTADKINQYHDPINTHIRNFKTFNVTIPSQGLELQPWVNWTNITPPLWWTANNKVKHERHQHFEKASLKNCLNAVAGLYISVIHLYYDQAKKGELQQLPKIFNVADEHFAGISMTRFGHNFKYRLTILCSN